MRAWLLIRMSAENIGQGGQFIRRVRVRTLRVRHSRLIFFSTLSGRLQKISASAYVL